MRLDLHLHSTCSDGLVAPADLVAAARAAGLDAIAITDHDTTAGALPAQRAAAALGGVAVIAGIEVTCALDGAEVHLLGYGIAPGHPRLEALEKGASVRRLERVTAIVERLRALGVDLSPADLALDPGCAAVGRPHVARALVRCGAVRSEQQAFAQFLRDGGPAHVPAAGIEVADAISLIRAAGGCGVWAHPSLADAREFGRVREQGLDGVEALRPSLDPATTLALERAARAHGLVITGGSDWHGAPRPALGSWFVTEHEVGAFLERLGVALS